MTFEDVLDFVNSKRILYSLEEFETACVNHNINISTVSQKIDIKHYWSKEVEPKLFETSTTIYQCDGRFIGVTGVSNKLFTNSLLQCNFKCFAQEFTKVHTTEFRPLEQ